jgi:hypothetical protein
MSLGAITGTIVIFRAFFQMRDIDNNYREPLHAPDRFSTPWLTKADFLVFMSIFNILEPSITIIAQAIPMFRVLVVNVKKGSSAVRISSPSGMGSRSAAAQRSWNSKVLVKSSIEQDEEMLNMGRMDSTGRTVRTHISGPDSSDDKLFDSRHLR